MTNTIITIIGMALLFVMTTIGASMVFLFKDKISEKANSLILGFAAGVMIAASVWSLLIPSIEGSEHLGTFSFLPAVIGFILGGVFLVLIDKTVPHFHVGANEEEGIKSTISKPMKMFLAVTIHNIPEGLAVGFAFGAAAVLGETSAYLSALGLAIGIGIQNLPEGLAVALPLSVSTGSRKKAFLFGMGSGLVEPISALIGFLLASVLTVIQPYLLAFSAGAMVFVVVEDLIPDAKISEHSHVGTWGVMLGFAIMMILDVALG